MTTPRTRTRRRYRIIHKIEEIPTFTSEQEERAFWETHDLSPDLLTPEPADPNDPLPPPTARHK